MKCIFLNLYCKVFFNYHAIFFKIYFGVKDGCFENKIMDQMLFIGYNKIRGSAYNRFFYIL
ncbi:hypothetical protein DCO56_01785 [Sphingobacterium athyrii]|uniref:Uncharacterized protein n=1 Tax=Sphingobacterium athyrii TaxID=2152717 RepID=A0A363NYC2_9SPHI|nr:hypothetical protein DCO56_01785 [Sphingobacterium athyrii]